MIPREQENYDRARRRVQKLKGFYAHFAVYIIINAALLLTIFLAVDHENFWQIGHFFTPIFWGVGLLLHGLNAYDYSPLLGRKWEERKIKELMDRDREDSKKYQ
jgi:hypothetical protein